MTASRQTDGVVYLMRHGRTALDLEHRSDGWLDMPLDAQGQLTTVPAQQRLKAIPLKTIYAPSLKRTTETAEIMKSGNIGDPPIDDSEESKTWNLGILAGTRKRYGRPAVQRLVDNPDRVPKGGESYNAFKGRFLPWFKARLKEARSSGEPILIVCSGSNLRLIGKEVLGEPDIVDLDEGGLAELSYKDGKWVPKVLYGAKEPPKTNGLVGGKEADLLAGGKAAIDEAFDDRYVMS